MFEVYRLINDESFLRDLSEYAEKTYHFELNDTLPLKLEDLKVQLDQIQSELDLIEKANLFALTYEPEYERHFEYFSYKSLELKLSVTALIHISKIMFEPLKTKFLFLHLIASRTPDEYINLLIEIQNSNYNDQLNPLFQDSFQYFFNLNPSILQINQVIHLIKKNYNLHILFTAMAFEKVRNPDEYQILDKPGTSHEKKYDFYKKAEKFLLNKLKRKYPTGAFMN